MTIFNKKKPLILCHREQVLARPVGSKWFQVEQFLALLRVEENPEGNQQALVVKGERHFSVNKNFLNV